MKNISHLRWQWFQSLVLASLFALGALTASAPETDNFSLPLDIELADWGDFFETVHTCAIEDAVATLNARIERALKLKDPEARARQLAALHKPDTLADAYMGRFSDAVTESYKLENALSSNWARRSRPGQKTTHNAIWMNFSAHVPIIDPRQWMMLSQCRTVKACGVYFGTDKFIHFHHVGYSYYKMYRALLKEGLSAEEAYRKVLQHHVGGGVLGEKALFGTVFTGIYSNADLAANHAGFKFLLNLTEEVVLKGQPRAPLALRCGLFWRLNQHVRPRAGWFSAYLSDHWNEALNPSLYEPSMRPGIRRVLRNRAEHIVQFYTLRDGRPNEPVYFDDLARELSTYYGEPYGHSGQFDKLMTIGNTCFPALHDPSVGRTP